MSKRDIETVCTLAAHLAQRGPSPYHYAPPYKTPGDCAADAMKLQRLAQNIRTRARNMHKIRWGTYLMNMCEKAEKVLRPYGLEGTLSPTGIVIHGLPSNTLGGDGEGFGI